MRNWSNKEWELLPVGVLRVGILSAKLYLNGIVQPSGVAPSAGRQTLGGPFSDAFAESANGVQGGQDASCVLDCKHRRCMAATAETNAQAGTAGAGAGASARLHGPCSEVPRTQWLLVMSHNV